MIKAVVMAGAMEAMRQRNRPGKWAGQKGFRVATAAISAGVIDAGLDKNGGGGSGSGGGSGGALGRIMSSAVGGMLVDKLANGGRR